MSDHAEQLQILCAVSLPQSVELMMLDLLTEQGWHCNGRRIAESHDTTLWITPDDRGVLPHEAKQHALRLLLARHPWLRDLVSYFALTYRWPQPVA